MNAWIDCMSSLDKPEDGMSTIHCAPGLTVTLKLGNVAAFRKRCPEEYSALIECSAFVNSRRLEVGEPPVLTLSCQE